MSVSLSGFFSHTCTQFQRLNSQIYIKFLISQLWGFCFFFFSEDEDDDLQYADHDYEVPQQKGLKKLWNRVKWTRDEVIM